MKLSKYDLGWLVGLIEADGTFTYDSRTNSPRIAVKMTDMDTVSRAATLLQTRLLGPHKNAGNRQDTYMCFISGKKARSWMEMLKPYMSLRRQHQIAVILGDQADLFPFPRDLRKEK